MGNNSRSEYGKSLDFFGRKFSKKYRFYISSQFDPMRWARSARVDTTLNGFSSMHTDMENGDDLSSGMNLWFSVASESEPETSYPIRLGIKKVGGKFSSVEYEHACIDRLATEKSGMPRACKHLYSVLEGADMFMESLGKSHVKSYCRPNPELLESLESIDKIKPALRKPWRAFEAMEENMKVYELPELERMNIRIEHIKRVSQ